MSARVYMKIIWMLDINILSSMSHSFSYHISQIAFTTFWTKYVLEIDNKNIQTNLQNIFSVNI